MIAGIVLAAGRGERIGHPKAWLETGRKGECFLARACRVLEAAGSGRVLAVVAPGWEEQARRVVASATIATNPEPDRGQLSSLQVGLRAVAGDLGCEAVIVLPVDVPLVTEATVRALVAAWSAGRRPVVRPVRDDGRHGHPVVFAREVFAELLRAEPSMGARLVVRAHASPAGEIRVDDEGAFIDIDTAEDYRRAFGRLPRPADLR